MTAPFCIGFNRLNYPALPNFAIHLTISLIHVITYTIYVSMDSIICCLSCPFLFFQ